MKFINLKDIEEESVIIDVRTKKEYKANGIDKYNINIMNEKDHKTMKKFIVFALPIIAYKVFKNRHMIDVKMKEILKENKGKQIIFICNKGRLRSPLTALYVERKFKIKTFVILGGVTRFHAETK